MKQKTLILLIIQFTLGICGVAKAQNIPDVILVLTATTKRGSYLWHHALNDLWGRTIVPSKHRALFRKGKICSLYRKRLSFYTKA